MARTIEMSLDVDLRIFFEVRAQPDGSPDQESLDRAVDSALAECDTVGKVLRWTNLERA